VIAVIKAAWTTADNAELAELQNKLASDLREQSACPGKVAKECGFISTSNYYSFRSGGGPGWYHLYPESVAGWSGHRYNTQNDCINDSINNICYNDEKAHDAVDSINSEKAKIADFKYRVDYYVFIAVQTTNYEGNIISYVDIRKIKNETIERYKASFERQGNALVLLNMDSCSQ
jgi:hypothetical protein